jgi:hypothetical protein
MLPCRYSGEFQFLAKRDVAWSPTVLAASRWKATDGRTTLTVSYIGYHPYKKTFISAPGIDTLALGDILLKPSDLMLKQLVVKGHAKRFTMHGDTVVFNPQAFSLAEGARLEDLIKKLPGVTLTDGQLQWMGKPVRILMDGDQLFGDNTALLGRLPAEAVKDIKAYNKTDHKSDRGDQKDLREDNVLDISIKPGWLERWYGDAKAGVQTGERYDAELDALFLSKTNPLMAYGHLDNVGVINNHKSYGSSSTSHTGPSVGSSLALSVTNMCGKGNRVRKTLDNSFSINAEGGHSDTWEKDHENVETYLPGTSRTYALSQSWKKWHIHTLPLEGTLKMQLDSATSLWFNFGFTYKKKLIHSNETSATYNTSPYDLLGDSPLDRTFGLTESDTLLRHVVNRSRYRSLRDVESQNSSVRATIRHIFRDESMIFLDGVLSYDNSQTKDYSLRNLQYPQGGGTSAFDNQYGHTPGHSFNANIGLSYARDFGKKVRIKGDYKLDSRRSYERRSFYRLDRLAGWNSAAGTPFGDTPSDADSLLKAFDPANSYRNKLNTLSHQFELSVSLDLKPLTLTASVSEALKNEKLYYQRGNIDTVATRTKWMSSSDWNPPVAINASLKINKMSGISANFNYSTTYPDLLSTVNYRDDTNPLFIQEGNSRLSTSRSHSTELSYWCNSMNRDMSVSLKAGYQKSIHPISSLTYYNSLTGAYRTRPENVKGGDTWTFSSNIDKDFGSHFHLSNSVSCNLNRNYNFLSITDEGVAPSLNLQHYNRFTEHPSFSYTNGDTEIALFGDLTYRYIHNKQTSTGNSNLYDYSYGFNAKTILWHFELWTELTDEAYRGYATTTMNRDRWLWNASIAYPVFKHKGKLKLELNDILNQNNNYDSDIQPTSRTESWSDRLHHFAMLSFTCHFDAKKTK